MATFPTVSGGSYSRLLKTFREVPPRRGLVGKAVPPLATGHMTGHGTLLHEALRTVLRSVDATAVVPGCFLTERAARSLRASRYAHARGQLARGTELLRRATARLPQRAAGDTRSAA
ncbi:hypothetical protein [Streptomyces mexicanus]|uniref:Uncharacterized protein n=1 Tax=Streptomyces mexicanus TaxID=178566 RepID=A0A7X1HY50_9ACTN|nr:hypothetical protein [Streptomyces mexicanus]MBC2865186.1 hypothetical protein [Streptomyces mexicanus]